MFLFNLRKKHDERLFVCCGIFQERSDRRFYGRKFPIIFHYVWQISITTASFHEAETGGEMKAGRKNKRRKFVEI